MFSFVRCVVIAVAISACTALDNGLALTPAMGYNSWNDFHCNITADDVMQVADKMQALGFAKLGYQYINIDDCWATSRDPDTQIVVPDPVAFPNGMKAVADYVHSKGFLFGIYTDRGNVTCKLRPGSWGVETIDANTYAEWGVDYVKEDSCGASQDPQTAFGNYAVMRDALNQTGRPVYFSLCGWKNWYAPVGWSLGNSWRTTGDVGNWTTLWNAVSINRYLASYARPGGWNDPDMLVGSNPLATKYLTELQSRTQFTLWAMMHAPLLIGSNILNISPFDWETYSNSEVIAVDQDPLGVQGQVFWQNCPVVDLQTLRKEALTKYSDVPECQQIWTKPLVNNARAVAFVNFGSSDVTLSCDSSCLAAMSLFGAVNVRDLWAHQDLGTVTSFESVVLANGGSAMFRVTQSSVSSSNFDTQTLLPQ